jgi:hypothetical protein
VLPTKRVDIDDPQNLDLNTTAKKGERGQDKLNPYLMNNTYCVINANLAYPIESFNIEKELTEANKIIEE